MSAQPKQSALFPFELPKEFQFKAPPLDVEKVQDEAMLDANWAADHEDEEPEGLRE